MIKKLMDEVRKGNSAYFYTSKTWKKKRLVILERDNNECQLCKAEGRVTTADKDGYLVVHHIQELKDKPELMLTDSNLLSVCNDCHENKCHQKRMGEFQERKRFTNVERWE